MRRMMMAASGIAVAIAVALGLFLLTSGTADFGDRQLKALDQGFIRVVMQQDFSDGRERAVLYESAEGLGVVLAVKHPLTGRWTVKESRHMAFEKGISQQYLELALSGENGRFALVYGQFTPAEDYNLPIRLRNGSDGLDVMPAYTDSVKGDIIWHCVLDKPSSAPDDFELYNGITGTVIRR